MTAELGKVASLWRYPVKSMQGEELSEAEATQHGLLGDRVYALIDVAEGKARRLQRTRSNGRRSLAAGRPSPSRRKMAPRLRPSASRCTTAPIQKAPRATVTRFSPRP